MAGMLYRTTISTRGFDIQRLSAGLRVISAMAIALTVSGCGINTIPTLEEQAKSAWSQVQNQYQRRAELIPNLVETVKGFAKQEREVLTQVIEARGCASTRSRSSS